MIPPSQFAPLEAFIHETALKRSLLLELAARLPIDQATIIVEHFEAFDTDHDGSISADELRAGFAQIGFHDEAVVGKIFRALDHDRDGVLTFSEFAAGMLVIFRDLSEDRLHTLFLQHDADQNGYLDRQEAEDFLADARNLLDKHSNPRSLEILDKLMEDCGRNVVTFDDLRDALLGLPQEAQLREREPRLVAPSRPDLAPAPAPKKPPKLRRRSSQPPSPLGPEVSVTGLRVRAQPSKTGSKEVRF